MTVLILALAPAAAGCGDQSAASGLQAVASRDSAGVLLVSLADALGSDALDVPTFTVPTSRFDGGDRPLYGVVAAFALPGESRHEVAVVDRGSSSIRVFGVEGPEVRRLGGPGDGPGEFRDLTAAGRLGPDSIWAFDFLAHRVTVFGPGDEVRTVRLETSRPFRTIVGHLGREFVAIESSVTARATESGLHRDSLDLALVSADEGRVQLFGRFPGDEIVLDVTPRPNGVTVSKRRLAQGYDTQHAIVDRRLATVQTESYRLELRGSDGALVGVIEADLRGRRIHSEYHERAPVLEALVAGTSRAGLPAIWLRLATSPGDSLATWIAHGSDGAVIGGARLPTGLRLTDVTADRFIGVEVDELGVERVAVFER
jgi:hypothetical protein